MLLLDVDREHQRPVRIVFDRFHEAVGDQQADRLNWRRRPSSRLALMNSLHVGMRNIERAHLRAAAAAGRGHGEAHLVVDIHERQRAGRVRAGAGDVRATRAQRRKFIADAATGFQREPGLVHLVEDVVHRIVDRARYRAVDRRGLRLVLVRAGVGRDATGRDRAAAQCPQEAVVPVGLFFRRRLDLGQRLRDALVGVVDGRVDRLALLGLQAVFLVPDVEGRGLQRNFHRATCELFQAHRAHSSYLSHCRPGCAPASLPSTCRSAWHSPLATGNHCTSHSSFAPGSRNDADPHVRDLSPAARQYPSYGIAALAHTQDIVTPRAKRTPGDAPM